MHEKSDFQAIIQQIDAAYAALIERAELLRDSFFLDARDLLNNGRKHVPIVMSIQKSTGNSTAIRWARMYAKRGTENSKTKPIPRLISKGTGRGLKSYAYPATCFQFLEPEMRHLVLHYDKHLSVIREQASLLLNHRKGVQKLLVMDESLSSFLEAKYERVTLSNPTGSKV